VPTWARIAGWVMLPLVAYVTYTVFESINLAWVIALGLFAGAITVFGRDYAVLEGKANATPEEVAVLRLLVPFGRSPEWLAETLGLGLVETGELLHSLRVKGYVTRPTSLCGGVSSHYYLVKPPRRAVRWMQWLGRRKQETVTA
jgi:hypothetical protein